MQSLEALDKYRWPIRDVVSSVRIVSFCQLLQAETQNLASGERVRQRQLAPNIICMHKLLKLSPPRQALEGELVSMFF